MLWTEESFDHCFSSSLGCQSGCRNTSPQNRDPPSCPSGANHGCPRTFHSHLSISSSHLSLSKPHLSPGFCFLLSSLHMGVAQKKNQTGFPSHTLLGDGQVRPGGGYVWRASNFNSSQGHGVGPGLFPSPPPSFMLLASLPPDTSLHLAWLAWSLCVPMISARGHRRHQRAECR